MAEKLTPTQKAIRDREKRSRDANKKKAAARLEAGSKAIEKEAAKDAG